MTALSMSHAIGWEVLWTTGSLEIAVRIIDVKQAYGRTRYLITPIAGSKSMWVQDGLQFHQEGA